MALLGRSRRHSRLASVLLHASGVSTQAALRHIRPGQPDDTRNSDLAEAGKVDTPGTRYSDTPAVMFTSSSTTSPNSSTSLTSRRPLAWWQARAVVSRFAVAAGRGAARRFEWFDWLTGPDNSHGRCPVWGGHHCRCELAQSRPLIVQASAGGRAGLGRADQIRQPMTARIRDASEMSVVAVADAMDLPERA
jgi:hypothetical protein